MDATDRDKTINTARESCDSPEDRVSDSESGLLRPGEEGYEEELADIREKVQAGIEQIAGGEVYTAEEVFPDLRQRIREISQKAE